MLSASRSRAGAAVAAALAVAALWALDVAPSAGEGADEDARSVTTAQDAVERAEADRTRIEASLADLEAEREELLEDLGERDARRDRATHDLRRARRGARSLAVLAYMTADASPVALGRGDADDVYRETLVRDGVGARRQAAAYYHDLRSQADDAVTQTTARLDDLEARIAAARADRNRAEDQVRAATTDLEQARAEAERKEAEAREAAALAGLPDPASVSTAGGAAWTPIGSISGGPTPGQWAQLRQCESGGNYRAVSPGGTYRGAYQFDLSTWRTVGGTGDPIAASPAEQDHRAQLLWQSRGHAPWPVCGRYLV